MSVLYFFESIRCTVLNYIAVIFAFPGEELFFICGLALLYWCFSKKTAYKLIITYTLFAPIVSIIINAVHLPSPWIADSSFHTLNIVMAHAPVYAFPCIGIFTLACLCTSIFINNYFKWVRFLCVMAVLLNILAYLYLGMCTLISAVVSAAIAILATAVFNTFFDGTLFDSSRNHRYMLYCIIPTFFSICVPLSLYLYDILSYDALKDAICLSGIYLGLIMARYIENRYIRFNIRCDHQYKQFLKALIGITAMLVIYAVLYLVFQLIPGFWFGRFIRNFIVVMVGFALYPVYIQKYFAARYN